MASVMVMAMGIMGRQNSRVNYAHRVYASVLALTACHSHSALARVLDFQVKPSVTVAQSYSDNLRVGTAGRASNQGKAGFYTSIAPGLHMARQGARLQFNLTAQLQYLHYEDIEISPKLYPQLQMDSKLELLEKSVFFDAFSTISQGNASAVGGFSPTNSMASNTINSTTYSTFRASPYWLPHFGGYAEGEVRVAYSKFANTTSSQSSTFSSSVANLETDSYQQSVYLHSGRAFDSNGINWRLNFNNQDQQRSGGNTSSLSDVRFRSTDAEISLRLVQDISAFVQLGYYDNKYSGNTQTNNGFYVTPGLYWKPSPSFSLAAGYGLNTYFSNVTWNPTKRTSFQLSYRDSQVGGSNASASQFAGGGANTSVAGTNNSSIPGLNLGGSSADNAALSNSGGYATGNLGSSGVGSVWNGTLRHQTRTSTWTASYITTTTTIQQYLFSLSPFTTPTDLSGNPLGLPIVNGRPTGLPDLNNGIITNRRFQLGVSWVLAKHNFALSGYTSEIGYSTTTGRDQNILGVQANWNWRFSPRLTSSIQGFWQTSEYKGSRSGSTDFLSASFTLSRQLSPEAIAALSFNHYETSSSGLNAGAGTFDSNSVTASFQFNF